MATTKKKAIEEEKEEIKETQETLQEPQEAMETEPEGKYTISELAAACGQFGASQDIIRAALTLAGRTEYGYNEAKQIINEFKNKEV